MILENISDTFEYERLSPEEMQSRGILGRLVGVIADTVNPTRNGRHYSEQLWEKALSNPIMQERINTNCCFGELGHPADREETDMEKIAICMDGMPKKDKNGKLQAIFSILDTPNGRILKTLCDYGCNIGVSSRGSGDVIPGYDGNEEVDPDSYDCQGWDAVIIPAVKEARLKYVNESLSNKKSLTESLHNLVDTASESDKKVMTETLKKLNIFESYNFKAVPFNYTLSYAGKSQDVSCAVVVIPNALSDGKITMDATIYCEDSNGKVIDFNTVEEANNWIDENKDNVKLVVKHRNEIHAVPIGSSVKVPESLQSIPDRNHFNFVVNKVKNRIDFSKYDNDPYELLAIECEKYDNSYFKDDYLEAMEYYDYGITDESLNINSSNSDMAVDNDKAIVEELQQTLRSKKELEASVTSLQEKLSVCYTKEASYEKDIQKYQQVISKLTKGAKMSEALTKKVAALEEQLSSSNRKIEEHKERIQKLQHANSVNLTSKKELAESISVKNSNIEKLNESITSLEKKIQVQDRKHKEEVSKLNESISNLQKDKELKDSEYSKKIANSNKLVEQYKSIAQKAVDRYIESKALQLGVSSNEIKNKLSQNYTFNDIDTICESLRDYKLSISKLPFQTSKINESVRMKVTPSSMNESILPKQISSDDEVDDQLLRITGL